MSGEDPEDEAPISENPSVGCAKHVSWGGAVTSAVSPASRACTRFSLSPLRHPLRASPDPHDDQKTSVAASDFYPRIDSNRKNQSKWWYVPPRSNSPAPVPASVLALSPRRLRGAALGVVPDVACLTGLSKTDRSFSTC